MKVSFNINEELLKWYEKRAANFGLDIDDLFDFVLNAYAKKTDPKKACAIPLRSRAALGMSQEEALSYVHFPLEKSLWQRALKKAEEKELDATAYLSAMIEDLLK